MSVSRLPSLQQRINMIQAELAKPESKGKATRWEVNYLNNLLAQKIHFGSKIQNEVLAKIERKVLGDNIALPVVLIP